MTTRTTTRISLAFAIACGLFTVANVVFILVSFSWINVVSALVCAVGCVTNISGYVAGRTLEKLEAEMDRGEI